MNAQCAALLLSLVLTATAAASTYVTPDHWRSDIDFLGSQLEKLHPNLFFQISRDTFEADLNAVKADVERLSDQEISFRLQQAVARVGDAHTRIEIRTDPTTYFPLSLYQFGNDLIVTRTTEASRGACSMKLVAIDGVDITDAYARVSTLVSHENDAWLSMQVPPMLVRSEVLHFLGVTAAADHARFTFADGRGRFDLDLTPIRIPAQYVLFNPPAETATTPLYQRSVSRWYWWTWDETRRLLYVKYNSCRDDPFNPFATFAKELFAAVDHEPVERMVVDLRNNGGGNSGVIRPLISGIKQRPWLRGRLYAIIGRETFSAGVTAALDLRDAGAILAGEPTGGKPNMYANVQMFRLGWSMLQVNYSTKYIPRITNADPTTLEPDVRVDLTMLDLFLDRDPVLDSIAPVKTAIAPVVNSGPRRRAVNPVAPLLHCPE